MARTAIRNLLVREDGANLHVNNSASISSATNSGQFSGWPLVEIKLLRFNEVPYSVRWTSMRNWRLRVPNAAAQTTLNFQGCEVYGNVLTNAAATVSLTYPGPVERGIIGASSRMNSRKQVGSLGARTPLAPETRPPCGSIPPGPHIASSGFFWSKEAPGEGTRPAGADSFMLEAGYTQFDEGR